MSSKPTIAEAWVGILPSMDGFEAKLAAGMGTASTAAGTAAGTAFSGGLLGAAKKLAVPLLAVLGVGAIFQGVGDSMSGAIDEASRLNESVNALDKTFGTSADGVAALGRAAANNLGLANTDFNALAVRFSSFATTITGEGGDVVDTLDEMTTRAADFASVNDLEVVDAARLFQSALAGESEPIRQYGKDISAAAVEAFALANGIGDGTSALTEAQKVQARYGLLMQETANTAGDFAATSDDLANAQRRLDGMQRNVSATLGTAFLPIMETFTGVLADAMPIVEMLAGFVADMSAAFFEGQDAGEVFSTLIEALQPALDELGAVFESDVIPAMQEAGRVFVEDLLPALVQAAPDLAKLLALGIEMAAMWLSDFLPIMTQVATFMASGLVASIQGVSGAIAWASDWFRNMSTTARDAIGNVVSWFTGMGDKLRTALSNVAANISAPFKSAFNAIAGAWNRTIGSLGFSFPTWLPGNLSGKSFNVPDIPYLANGGIVTRPTLAVLGDNPSGAEMVVPLERADEFGFGDHGGELAAIMRQVRDELKRRQTIIADNIAIAQTATQGQQLLAAGGGL